jgi:hypothetical protein
MRDENGEIHRKRGDTHIGTIEKEYGIDLGVRSDTKLGNYLDDNGYDSLSQMLRDR